MYSLLLLLTSGVGIFALVLYVRHVSMIMRGDRENARAFGYHYVLPAMVTYVSVLIINNCFSPSEYGTFSIILCASCVLSLYVQRPQ